MGSLDGAIFPMKARKQNFILPISILLFGSLILGLSLMHKTHVKHTERALKKTKERRVVEANQNQNLEKFSLAGFDDKGKKFWNLEGDNATIDTGQTVYLDKNVTFKLQDNTTIYTDRVRWYQDTGVMKTSATVFVDHETTKVTGRGAIGKPADSFIQINRHITMKINDSTTLTCLGPMKIYYKQNRMIFYRKVKVVDDKGVLTANRMDVIFSPTQKKVEQIVAVGDVVIARGADTTHSRRAIYTLATGSVRLEGNPQIMIHKDGKALLNGPFGS